MYSWYVKHFAVFVSICLCGILHNHALGQQFSLSHQRNLLNPSLSAYLKGRQVNLKFKQKSSLKYMCQSISNTLQKEDKLFSITDQSYISYKYKFFMQWGLFYINPPSAKYRYTPLNQYKDCIFKKGAFVQVPTLPSLK